MKRLVEMVGIGDTGTLSGTLQVSPLHADDVGLVILGSQNGTQTGNLLEIRNSTGTALMCADADGKLTAASLLSPATELQGTTTAVGIQLTSTLSSNSNQVNIKKQGVSTLTSTSKTVGLCATTSATVASAAYISIPASSTALIQAFVTAFCTAGTAVSSAGAYIVQAMATSGGHAVTQTTTPLTGVLMSENSWTASIAPAAGAGVTAGVVCLTFTGSATTAITWGYDMTCVLMTVV